MTRFLLPEPMLPRSAVSALSVLACSAALLAQVPTWITDDALPSRTAAVYWDAAGDRLVAVCDWPVRAWSFDGQRWRKHEPAGLGDEFPDAILLYAGFDSANQRGLVVTGQGPSEFLARTHLAVGAGFTLRRPHSSPYFRGVQPAVDPVTGDLLVFGGTNLGFVPTDGMAAWNGNNWRTLSPAGRPSARADPGMVTDRARNRVVLFGGAAGAQMMNDTWEWDGVQWLRMQPANAPTPRRARLAYDPAVQRVVALGGRGLGSPYLSDCWEWDGVDWRAAPSLPVANQAFGCDDGTALQLVMGYASVWQRTATGWSARFRDPRPEDRPFVPQRPKVAWDAARGEIVMPMLFPSGETFRYDGEWQLVATQGPPPRQAFGFAPLGSDLVLFGGVDNYNSASRLYNDTWSWSGQSWTALAPPVAPSPRQGVGMASDGSGVLLFGGSASYSPFLAETWRFDGSAWVELVTATVPPGREAPAMAYDPVRDRVVLFGGYAVPSRLRDTFEWDGTNWLATSPSTSPPAGPVSATFDAGRGRVVLMLGQLWEWDGVDWTATATSPTLGGSGDIAYYPPTGRLIGRRLWDTHTLTTTPARVELVTQACGRSPDLRLLGRPVVDTAPDVHVEGQPNAVAFVVHGLLPDQLSLAPGCDVLLQPLTSQVGVTDAFGRLDLPLAIPNDLSLRGVAVLSQAAVLDGGPVFGASLSGRLRVVVGD
ncbi:MAG: hypothetical protein NXI31_06200 [bacterium]|nr:hypothetical protein [bacterium]